MEGQVKSGTVIVLVGQEQLMTLKDQHVQNQISVLKSPKFWQIADTNDDNSISWTKLFKARVKWGFLYTSQCKVCKNQIPIKIFVNTRGLVNYAPL